MVKTSTNSSSHKTQEMVDQGTQLEKIIKDLFLTLDTQFNQTQSNQDSYRLQFLPQLKSSSPVIINGNPIAGKQGFQEHWLKFPLSQHNITSLDFHTIPGTGTMIVNLSGKVRFDESGKSKTGESADSQQLQVIPSTPASSLPRNVWGSWLGFNANLVLDVAVFNNINTEVINSLNWKIIYKPDDILVTI